MDINIQFFNHCQSGNLPSLITFWNSYHNRIDIHSENDFAFRMSCINCHIEIAKWLSTLSHSYFITIENDKIIDFKIIDDLDGIPITDLHSHTSLKQYLEPDTDCPICCENSNLYMLPCSKETSYHILCGECIMKLRHMRQLKCQECTQLINL